MVGKLLWRAAVGVSVLLVVVGCTGDDYEPLPRVPSSSSSTTTAGFDGGFPSARGFGQMAALPAIDSVLLFGGGPFVGRGTIEDQWLFDIATESWRESEAVSVPEPRTGHVMEYVDSLGQVVMFGGDDRNSQLRCLGTGCPPGLLDDMWTYDPVTDDWVAQLLLQGSPGPRSGAAAAYDSLSDQLVVFGGIGAWDGNDVRGRETLLGDLWAYDPATQEWTAIDTSGPTPGPRAFSQMVYDPNTDRIVMWGGFTGEYSATDPTVWSLDIDNATWQAIDTDPSASPDSRWFHAMDYDPATGLIVMFGGERYDNGTRVGAQDVWLYDHMSRVWQRAADLDGPASRPHQAATGDGSMLALIGGWTARYDIATDTWRWWNAEGEGSDNQ